jgi:hypothetical protein
LFNERAGKKSVAPSHNLPKILPEVEEVIAHHDDNKIEELLKERDP